ncbi:MAG: filamentous hemagglutinin N-terminal domain-containing protein, partial [Cyanobacteria bacterium P01_G01_bin.19]
MSSLKLPTPKMFNRWLNCLLPRAIATVAISLGYDGFASAQQPNLSWRKDSSVFLAQIIPDNSLGNENSVVTPGVEVKGETADRIDGGAIRDRNLFHSFSEFNLNEGQRVFFANPNNIEQIFTRITGENPSNINGTLGVDGAADLLLLNPNGIIFGENSSLDIEGSFFGTSADSLLFEDNTEFSAVEPSSSLLTISVPMGLQLGNNPGSILVRSPLNIAEGQNFALLGGEIELEGSNINTDEEGINSAADGIIAPGGQIDLGSVSTEGTVTFDDNSNLVLPENIPQANITLDNYFINASAGGGGSISLQSRNLSLIDSFLVAGINSSVESTKAQAGNIDIKTTDTTLLETTDNSQSGILNTTGANITGDLSQVVDLTDNSEAINITGNAGNITIDTSHLRATGLFLINSLTNGEGNAGKIEINATSSVELDLQKPLNPPDISAIAGILSSVGDLGTGDSANIEIDTPSLSLSNVIISTSTIGAGNAGNISINTDDFTASDSVITSEAISSGDGANIDIDTLTLSLNGGGISTSTIGAGDAGNTTINALDSIDISNTIIIAETFNSGDAGNIFFESETADITLENSLISTTVAPPGDGFVGTGRGGDIAIAGRTFSTFGNSVISTATAGEVTAEGLANAGDLTLDIADSITVGGRSILLSSTAGAGDAGNLSITTENLRVIEEGEIRAGTGGTGNGGEITIAAKEIELRGILDSEFGNGIGAITQGAGNGGTINIMTDNLSIHNNANLSVRSFGEGDAGAIFARVNNSVNLNNGNISSRSDRSSGGEITILAGDIRLRGDSDIQTNVENGGGGGGNITLSADSIAAFDDSDIFAFSADGIGGDITLATDVFFASNFSSFSLNAEPQFLNNNSRVDINASGLISGSIDIPKVNFLPNSFAELSEDTIDADEVIVNSCAVNREGGGGTFIITGVG